MHATPLRFPKQGGYLLSNRAAPVLSLIAARSGQGDVYVLDGGGCFNAYDTARAIRLRTVHLYEWQARIQIARAFTCHEMTALLAHIPATPAPVFILDLLATFFDDAVTDNESTWLLRLCLTQLQRLQKCAPVFVTLPPPRGEQTTQQNTQRDNLPNLLRRSLQPLTLDTLKEDNHMGKTTPTIADLIRDMESILSRFRQVLHPTQRAHLDGLIVKARKHMAAISQANHLLPIETILLAMSLEQEIEKDQLAARIIALEMKLKQLELKQLELQNLEKDKQPRA